MRQLLQPSKAATRLHLPILMLIIGCSGAGGAMSLDVEKNALCYGAATKAEVRRCGGPSTLPLL